MTAGSMLVLAVALLWGTVGPARAARPILFGVLLGASGNMIRTVEAASLPHYFGTLHLGCDPWSRVSSISVGGTAAGPLLFAAVYDQVGSYSPVMVASAAVPLAIAVWALVAREPNAACRL